MNENEMTYTEVVERRAEIRKAMTEVEVMRRERTVAEQGVFQENLLNEHNRHRKVIEEIESDTMKRKAELRNEMERINPTAAVEQPTEQATSNPDAAVTIIVHNGEKMVRVQALTEDFVIALHDLKDAEGNVMKDCDYDTLMARLKELNLDTFNRKQGFIIATCIEAINAKLVEAGGDKFDADLYVSKELWRPVGSSADCSGVFTWYFNGDGGCFADDPRSFGTFRSRPVLAYNSLS